MLEAINTTQHRRMMHLSWEDVEKAVEAILPKLPFRPQVVVGLARGGVIAASLIHRHFPKAKFETIQVKSYDKDDHRGQIRIERFNKQAFHEKRILVVDDIYDSGATIQAVRDRLSSKGICVAVAVLVHKGTKPPNIMSWKATTPDTWAVFPWEESQYKLRRKN